MKKENLSKKINSNFKTSYRYYWNYDDINKELDKFIATNRSLYNENGFSSYGYSVSINPITFTEKDLYKSSKNIKSLYDKFNKLQDDNVIDMFRNFFDLFLRAPSVYTLLSDLIDIYNADVKDLRLYGRENIKSDKKIKLLERSLDIFKHLLNRDEILETIIKEDREKLSDMLLNEDNLLYYIKEHSKLFQINKTQQAMDSIFPQLRGNQSR